MNETTNASRRPPQTGGRLRAILLLPYIVLASAFLGFISWIGGLIHVPRIYEVATAFWAKSILWLAGVRVREEWRGALTPAGRYVFVVNHQSALDIPILLKVCFNRHSIRFLAKESLFKIPFLGWALGSNGFIPIRRDNPRHSAEIFRELTQKKQNITHSYIVFAEGTRSDDGRMQSFKRGSIALMLRLGFPIVPVTISDACRVNPKGQSKLRAGTVQIVFHPPIEVPENGGSRTFRDELTTRLEQTVASALPEDQKPLPGVPAADGDA